jgi:hypothetical protein
MDNADISNALNGQHGRAVSGPDIGKDSEKISHEEIRGGRRV